MIRFPCLSSTATYKNFLLSQVTGANYLYLIGGGGVDISGVMWGRSGDNAATAIEDDILISLA